MKKAFILNYMHIGKKFNATNVKTVFRLESNIAVVFLPFCHTLKDGVLNRQLSMFVITPIQRPATLIQHKARRCPAEETQVFNPYFSTFNFQLF